MNGKQKEHNMKLQAHEEKHYNIIRKLAPECMVLLKSNGDFPLKEPQKVDFSSTIHSGASFLIIL